MFTNECIGKIEYEGVAAAILMAGLFVSFLVEYLGNRLVWWQAAKKAEGLEASSLPKTLKSAEMVSIYVMEAGVIFHSLRE
jgi:solute carrier family 39 (zinc transporter), member 1/2/3